jgi:hypothetical protein
MAMIALSEWTKVFSLRFRPFISIPLDIPDLLRAEQARLEALLAYSTALWRAYRLREQLSSIFKSARSKKRWAQTHPFVALAGRKERLELLRAVPLAALALAGPDCELLHRFSLTPFARMGKPSLESVLQASPIPQLERSCFHFVPEVLAGAMYTMNQ